MYPSDAVERFVRATGPAHDEIRAEMAADADEHGFPIIGPESGALLHVPRERDGRPTGLRVRIGVWLLGVVVPPGDAGRG
jgi:hypothetical protein